MLKNTILILTVVFGITFIFYGCGNSNKTDKTVQASVKIKPKVSVYYLHQKKGCMTCKAIGKISKATTEKYYQKEMKDGLLAYFDLDISQPVNDSIAKKLECTWSGLYIISNNNGKEVAEDLTDVAFMYAVNNPDTLEQIVKSIITDKL